MSYFTLKMHSRKKSQEFLWGFEPSVQPIPTRSTMYSKPMATVSGCGLRLLVSSYTNWLDLNISERGYTLQADCTAVVFL